MADHTTMGTGDEHPDHDLYGTTAGNPTTAYGDATRGSGSSTGEATRRDKAERKAKGDTMFKVAIGVVVVAVGGVAAYKFGPQIMGSHQANRPQPVSAIATPAAPVVASAPGSLSGAVSAPIAAGPSDSGAPALGPNTPTLGTAAPTLGGNAPTLGTNSVAETQAPGLAAASAPSETIAPLGASSAAPVFATPVSPSAAAPSLNTPSLNAAPSLGAQSAASAAVVVPVISTPVAVAQSPIDTSSQAGLARALTALTSQLSDLKSTIQDATTTQNKKIDDLADRVARLEEGRAARGHHAASVASADSASSSTAAADSAASASAAAPVAKPAHRVARHHYAARPHRHAAVAPKASSEDSGVLFDKAAAKDARHDTPDGAANAERQFSLQATIPGRLWIKNSDGSSSTFGVGDVLPDGSKVQSIDADNYSVRTSRGVLH